MLTKSSQLQHEAGFIIIYNSHEDDWRLLELSSSLQRRRSLMELSSP